MSYLDRLGIEKDDLNDKLSRFFDTKLFESLDELDQSDLRRQFTVMLEYRNILLRRIERGQGK